MKDFKIEKFFWLGKVLDVPGILICLLKCSLNVRNNEHGKFARTLRH
jgi:hypothetical protein